jgi:hypothetical protein
MMLPVTILQECGWTPTLQPICPQDDLPSIGRGASPQAHRSIAKANSLARMTKEEQLMATTMYNMLALDMIDNTTHISNPKLITDSEVEIKVWGYVMTQYNLKAGLRRFGDRGKTTAMEEMTQLHIMDT